MRNSVFFLVILIFLLFSCTEETERMSHYKVHGIDVSHYQSKIDWPTVAQQDITFAFVKATEGETLQDSLFLLNWNEIKRVGIHRGAYHFFRPTISALKQANHFIDQVDLETGDLPPVLDVEVLDKVSGKELREGVAKWLKVVESKYKIKPIIYTNLKFYQKHLANHFDEYPIWIARYNKKEPRLDHGLKWSFWQYGNRGKLTGIEGDVDFNVFNGSRRAFIKMTINKGVEPKGSKISFVW